MNTVGNNGPHGDDHLRPLYNEIATLKTQRNELQAALAECRRENAQLRAQLEERDS